MRDRDIGDVIVMEQNRAMGIVTDRDIVVRVVASGQEAGKVKLADICSKELHTVKPTDSVEEAINLMRDKAVRRILVVEDDRPVGIVSIGDLAVERDRRSALGDISAAPPNQ
jgi:CBS domain-containing protein